MLLIRKQKWREVLVRLTKSIPVVVASRMKAKAAYITPSHRKQINKSRWLLMIRAPPLVSA